MQPIVQSTNYNQATDSIKCDIDEFVHQIWPSQSSPLKMISKAHHQTQLVQSFYIYRNEKLISYAGVVTKTIQHKGYCFNLAGLSCVATAPPYRNQGLGNKIVTTATNWIANQKTIDFGIFTCHPTLYSFYHHAGDWDLASDVALIGNKSNDALSSETLDVVVLMRLFTERASRYQSILHHATVNLDFPKGEFL